MAMLDIVKGVRLTVPRKIRPLATQVNQHRSLSLLPMHSLLKLVGIVAAVLAIPLLTIALWSDPMEAWLKEWHNSPPPAGWLVGSLIALLAADILLPVPSGPLITLAGGQLGAPLTAAAAWLGLMLGGLVAFALAKRWGRPLAYRFADEQELKRLETLAREHDAWLLLVTRPLPILAEAAVLLVGILNTPWPRAIWTLCIGNAVVAITFAVLGEQAEENEWMFMAIVLSIVVPLAGTWLIRRRHLRLANNSGECQE